jgi:hypothetical protein
MAIIDTLKLARALRDRGGFTPEAAEATAEALGEALGEQVASKADLDQATQRLEHRIDQRFGRIHNRIDKLNARLNFMQWQIGIIAGLQIAALVKLFLR